MLFFFHLPDAFLASVFILFPVTAVLLDQLPSTRLIGTPSTSTRNLLFLLLITARQSHSSGPPFSLTACLPAHPPQRVRPPRPSCVPSPTPRYIRHTDGLGTIQPD